MLDLTAYGGGTIRLHGFGFAGETLEPGDFLGLATPDPEPDPSPAPAPNPDPEDVDPPPAPNPDPEDVDPDPEDEAPAPPPLSPPLTGTGAADTLASTTTTAQYLIAPPLRPAALVAQALHRRRAGADLALGAVGDVDRLAAG